MPNLLRHAMYLAAITAALSATTAASRVQQRAGEVLDVRATDFAFDASDSVHAGSLTVRLRNDGLMVHEAWLLRLDAGHTARDLERELAGGRPLPEWVSEIGGPAAPIGGSAEVTVELEAGEYVMVCAARLADGTRAVMKGMYRTLAVEAAATRTSTRRPDAVGRLSDRSLDAPRQLARGRRLLRVRNAAVGARDLRLYRLPANGDVAPLRSWLMQQAGPPPVESLGSLVGLGHGVTAMLALDLTPGWYALVSQPAALREHSQPSTTTLIHSMRVP